MPRHLALLASIALASPGCAWLDSRLHRLEHSVRLTVAAPARIRAGGTAIRVTLGVENISSQSVDLCIGLARTVTMDVDGHGGMLMSDVHPERCGRRFQIGAGAAATWDEPLDVAAPVVGRHALTVAVPIADPLTCPPACATHIIEARTLVIVD